MQSYSKLMLYIEIEQKWFFKKIIFCKFLRFQKFGISKIFPYIVTFFFFCNIIYIKALIIFYLCCFQIKIICTYIKQPLRVK